MPTAQHIGIETFASRFELRTFNDATATSIPINGNGLQLDVAVINSTDAGKWRWP